MGTSEILLGGNPVIGQHHIQGGVAILLGMLHAKESRDKLQLFGPLFFVHLYLHPYLGKTVLYFLYVMLNQTFKSCFECKPLFIPCHQGVVVWV